MKKLPVNQIICGDCIEVTKSFPSESIDMVMFSPPYYGLRDYGKQTQTVWGGKSDCEHEWGSEQLYHDNLRFRGRNANVGNNRNQEIFSNPHVKVGFCVKCGAWLGQLGLEPSWQMYVEHMSMICREIKRVLKKIGRMYIVLGDTYAGSGCGSRDYRDETATGILRKRHRKRYQNKAVPQLHSPNYQAKCLMGIPWRVAFALIENAWILRNDIIWHKPNHMPSSVKDRLTSSYEHILHFVKAKKYYYDLDAIRQPHKETSARWGTLDKSKAVYHEESPLFTKGYVGHPKGKNPGDVVKVPYSIQPRLKDFVEVRNLPPIDELKEYLNKWRKKRGYTIEQVEAELKSQAPHHWFNGESYPTKEDWLRIKKLLEFDEKHDKQMMAVSLKPAEKQNYFKGKNPGDVVKHDIAVGRVGNLSYTDPLHVKAYSDKGKNPGDVLQYKSKYREVEYGQSLQAFTRTKMIEASRAQSRIDAKQLFPNDPKKQQEYVNYIHDHLSHPKGPNPGDVIKYRGQDVNPHEGHIRRGKEFTQAFADGTALHPEGKNPSDFWSINTKPFKGAHFAVFPEDICEKPIKSSCPQNGIVLDIMCGSGTTCIVAKKLGRNYIGIELNPEYVKIAKARLSVIPEKLEKFMVVADPLVVNGNKKEKI